MTVMLCQHCKKPLVKRMNERPRDFESRKFCSKSCKTKHQMVGRRAAIPREREYVIGEVKYLLGTDNPESLATRLGYVNLGSLLRMLVSEDEHELARKLQAQSLDRAVECPECLRKVRPSYMEEHRANSCAVRSSSWGRR